MRRVSNSNATTGKPWRVIVAMAVLAGSLGVTNGHAAPVGFSGTLTIDFSASGGGTLVIPGSGTANVSGPAGALTMVSIPAGAFSGSGSIPISAFGGGAVVQGASIQNGLMIFSSPGGCSAGHMPSPPGFPGVVCPAGGLAGGGAINGLSLVSGGGGYCGGSGAAVAVPNIGAGSMVNSGVNCSLYVPPVFFPIFSGVAAIGAGFRTGAVSVPPLSAVVPNPLGGGSITFTAPGAVATGSQAAGSLSLVSPIRATYGVSPWSGTGAGIARLQLSLTGGGSTTTTTPGGSTTTSTSLPSGGGDVGITGKKLVIVDKLSAASKAKFVYVAKDTPADKGASNDATMISATFDAQITGLPSGTSAHFDMAQGANWLVNKPTVAKYVNKDAPTGGGVKVSVIKPMKLLKMVGKSLGDSPVDVFQAGDATASVDVATQYTVVDGGATRRHCGEFTDCKRKIIGGGSGAKVVCKTAVPGASVACP